MFVAVGDGYYVVVVVVVVGVVVVVVVVAVVCCCVLLYALFVCWLVYFVCVCAFEFARASASVAFVADGGLDDYAVVSRVVAVIGDVDVDGAVEVYVVGGLVVVTFVVDVVNTS